MKKKLQRMLAVLLISLVATFSAALADDVTITEGAIVETTDDLMVDYRYPVFAVDDAPLADALDASITQACLAQYDALHAAYQADVASRTDELAEAYASDDAFIDMLTGDYAIITNDTHFIQIVTPTSYQPAAANGDWTILKSYVFDTQAMRLLLPEDLFEDAPEKVYEELSRAAQAYAEQLPDLLPDASAQVTADTPFYYTESEQAIHLLFDPEALTSEDMEIILSTEELSLTFKDFGPIQ